MMREKVVVVEVEEEEEVEWWWWCRSSGGWLSQGRVFALEEQRSGRCGTTMRGEEGDNGQTGSDYSTTKRLCDEE